MAESAMSMRNHRAPARTPARQPGTVGPTATASSSANGAVAQLRHALAGRAQVLQMKQLASALQRKQHGAVVQRQSPEEEEPVQAKADPARGGLPAGLQSGIESMSGMDMSDVQVHRNSSRPASLDALAYAQGNDIHLAPGQEQHLPHEAWHVVQQRQGRVQPTLQMQGVGINDDTGLESEADRMGSQAQAAKHQGPA